MKTKHLFLLIIAFLVINSCNKKNAEPNNIYKFKEYINYTTSGIVSVSEKISVNFAKEVEGWGPNQDIFSKIVSIKPFVNGKIKTVNKHAFLFIPDENLEPNTEYSVTVKLGDLYQNIPDEFKTYTFKFKTIRPNFSVQIGNIQSYFKDIQYIEGNLKSADIISLKDALKLLKASQNGKVKKVVWNESYEKSRFFDFKIDNVQRLDNESSVKVSWDGNAIKADTKGKNEVVIPAKNSFKVLSIRPIDANEQYISINFSDALKKQQNFDGLVTLDNEKSPRFIINGNELKVFSEVKFSGNIKVNVFQRI